MNKNNKKDSKIQEYKSVKNLKEYLNKKTNHNYLLKSNDIDLYKSKYIKNNIINNIKNDISKNNYWTLLKTNNTTKNKNKSYNNNYIFKSPYNNIDKRVYNNEKNKNKHLKERIGNISFIGGNKNDCSNDYN